MRNEDKHVVHLAGLPCVRQTERLEETKVCKQKATLVGCFDNPHYD